MENQMTDLYHSLSRHFSALCSVPVTIVDHIERKILFTQHSQADFFCDRCPNRCRLLPTMLYGCNEARRWNGRYIFYCPAGLVFSAVTIPETDHTVLAGPLIMGEVQDTLFDLPDNIDPEEVKALYHCSADVLNHMSSILEMAVNGLRYQPNPPSYDRNITNEKSVLPDSDQSEHYPAFPFADSQEKEFLAAVETGNKETAKSILNQLLRYVYSPRADQLELIKSRAIQLVLLLLKTSAVRDPFLSQQDFPDFDPGEEALYRGTYIPALQSVVSLEELDRILAELLHHFIDYTFDFPQIRHSDAIYHAMEYIKSHYAERIVLEDIASYVYLSSSHISSLFHKETGQTVSAYINQVRIEKSKPLLANTRLSILEVAALCGFEDQSYFTRVFKKLTGLSPKKFRDQGR